MLNINPAFLAPVGPILHDVVVKGFETYPEKYSGVALDHSATSRASLIHDHIVAVGRDLLPAYGFRLTQHGGRRVFTFKDQYVVQFKRLDDRLMPQNVETRQSRTLYREGIIEGLEGIELELPFVTVGYRPDQFWRSPLAVYATRIVNQRHDWIQRLDASGLAQDELPISPPAHEHHRPTTARIKTPPVRRGSDTLDPIYTPVRISEARAG